jgi:hypothetical protein
MARPLQLPARVAYELHGDGFMNWTPGLSKLPGLAFATLAATGATIAITRGQARYERLNTTESADELNRRHGVTPAQARAMLAGVLCGWRTNLANPELYGPYGELLDEPPGELTNSFEYGLG